MGMWPASNVSPASAALTADLWLLEVLHVTSEKSQTTTPSFDLFHSAYRIVVVMTAFEAYILEREAIL